MDQKQCFLSGIQHFFLPKDLANQKCSRKTYLSVALTGSRVSSKASGHFSEMHPDRGAVQGVVAAGRYIYLLFIFTRGVNINSFNSGEIETL